MIKNNSLLLVVASLAISGVLLAGTRIAAADDPDRDWLALEEARYAAMVRVDLPALRATLSDDLIFTHASGRLDDKASFLEKLSSGTLVYEAITTDDLRVQAYDACVVITGRSLLEIKVRGEARELNLRFTSVWVEDEDGWKIVAYQSTHTSQGT